MKTSIQLLDTNLHRTHGFKPGTNYAFAAQNVCAPLLLNELASAVAYFPLAFIKYEDGHRYQLNALLGLEKGSNLFVNPQGDWLPGGYIPSCFRSYPFSIKRLSDEEPYRWAIGFDRRSGLYRENPDEEQDEVRFFDDQGQMLPYLQQLTEFCAAAATHEKLTLAAVDALAASDLLVPWDLNQELSGGRQPMVAGLFRVNEQALKALDGPALKELQSVHALPLAYAQLLSTQRIKVLHKVFSQKKTPSNLPQDKASVDMLFGEVSEEKSKFDWSKL